MREKKLFGYNGRIGRIDPDKLEETKKAYYQMLGWNEKGVPTDARLAELGIEWAKEYIPNP